MTLFESLFNAIYVDRFYRVRRYTEKAQASSMPNYWYKKIQEIVELNGFMKNHLNLY